MFKYRQFFTLPINLQQKKYAWNLAKRSGIGNRRGGANGSLEERYTGLLGEVIFCDRLFLSRPGNTGFDRGIDFNFYGINVDLKTQGRTCYYSPDRFVNNLLYSQVNGENYVTDVYLFANIVKGQDVMEFIGWITKREVIAEVEGVTLHRKGVERERTDGSKMIPKANFYEVKTSALRPFVNPETFRLAMPSLTRLF